MGRTTHALATAIALAWATPAAAKPTPAEVMEALAPLPLAQVMDDWGLRLSLVGAVMDRHSRDIGVCLRGLMRHPVLRHLTAGKAAQACLAQPRK